MSTNARPQIDYTNKDYESLRQAMLDLAKEKLPEWTDYSPNDLGVVLVELFAYMGDMLMYYQDRIANESYLDTAVEPHSITNLLRLIGYEIRPPRPATAGIVLKYKKPVTAVDPTEVVIDKNLGFKAKSTSTDKPIFYRYLDTPIKVSLKTLPSKKEGTEEFCYYPGMDKETLPVVQVDKWIKDEIAGSSNGAPSLRFMLKEKSIISETIKVTIDSSLWQRQPSLLASHSPDKHYTLVRDENDCTSIVFGDGKFGLIPPIGKNNIHVEYCTGGGSKGNVPSGAINQCDAQNGVTKPVSAFNTDPATGGAESEQTLEAAKNGPLSYRSLGRAVTADDYAVLARKFGAAKARARKVNWNKVELYVAPDGGGKPTDAFINDVSGYFDSVRLLTTQLVVKGPVYKPVVVIGDLEVEPYYFSSQVKQQVQNAISALLSFEKMDFNFTLYLSKFYEAAEAIDGVKSIIINKFYRATETGNEEKSAPATSESTELGKLKFDWAEIPRAFYPEGILLTVTGGRSDR